MPKTTKPSGPTYLTRSDAKELIDSELRNATRELSRELEKHLANIHERLTALEPRRG
jgi:hypothetical protein